MTDKDQNNISNKEKLRENEWKNVTNWRLDLKNIIYCLHTLFVFQIDNDIAIFDVAALQEIFQNNVFHINIEGGIQWPFAEPTFQTRKRG